MCLHPSSLSSFLPLSPSLPPSPLPPSFPSLSPSLPPSLSLSMSPSLNSPWLAVGLQPGKMFQPKGNKLVYFYNWETRERHHIFDAGKHAMVHACATHDHFCVELDELLVFCYTCTLCLVRVSVQSRVAKSIQEYPRVSKSCQE